MPTNPIYRLKAELMDTNLKIWREFEVVNNIPLSKLGYIVMSIFNMRGSHLFQFIKENENEFPKENYLDVLKEYAKQNVETKHQKQFFEYAKEEYNPESNEFVREMFESRHKTYYFEIPDPYGDNINPYKVIFDATKTNLNKVLIEANETMVFNYDFGDDWNVEITLLEIYTDKETHGREFPRVLLGQGLGIIENCGGVGGLEDLVKAYAQKNGKEYDNYVAWLDEKEIDFDEFDIANLTYLAKGSNRRFKEMYEDFD